MRYFQPNRKKNVKMKCPSGLQLMTGRRGGRRAQEMEVVVGKENTKLLLDAVELSESDW